MSHTIAEPPVAVAPYSSTRMATSEALEIRVFWGDTLLNIIELSPPRAFFVGDRSLTALPLDFVVPGEHFDRAPLVTVIDGEVRVHVPEGATAVRRRKGGAAFEGEPLLKGAFALADGAIDVRIAGLLFSMRTGPREARCPRALLADADARPFGYFAMSALLGGVFVASMAFLAPPLGLTDDEALDRDRMYLIQQYLDAAAEREHEMPPADGNGEAGALDSPADWAVGESGKIGKIQETARDRRASGTAPGADFRPATSRQEAISAAQNFGLIGLLTSGVANATLAPWEDNGVGSIAAAGGFFGSEIGDVGGMGGLGPLGIGEGGGGHGNQIGLASIGTCRGEGCTQGLKWGIGRNGTRPDHATGAPRLRMAGDTRVSGSLPPEVIQRVVRQSFGRFRGCYEEGLRTNPNLEGRVTARFVIARDGSVGTVQSGGTDLPDPHVVACVLRTYSGLTFPSPKDGIVTVTYPLAFSPAA